MSDGDLYKRVERLEASHDIIARDLRETSDSLKQVAADMSVLVNNVSHLTDAVNKLATITDKTQRIEIDLVEMRSRTESLKKLWSNYDKLKERVDIQSTVSKGVTFVAGSTVIAVIALLVSTLGGSG